MPSTEVSYVMRGNLELRTQPRSEKSPEPTIYTLKTAAARVLGKPSPQQAGVGSDAREEKGAD